MFGWLFRERLDRLWLWIALGFFVLMLGMNALAGGTTLLGGLQTGDVSDLYSNLFTPAGFTFSIWSLIYLLLGLFILRTFKVIEPKKPQLKNKEMNQLVVLFTLTSILNATWLVMWQYQLMTLSTFVMICLLITLIKINNLLHKQKMSLGEYTLVRVPFSVYLGWISVATIANITVWLVSWNWDGFGLADPTWMVIVLILGALIALVMGYARRDPAYVAVFVWAYFGILYKHMSGEGFDGEYDAVIAALVILLPVLVTTSIQLIREHEHAVSLDKLLTK
jgi:hypothetical protein